MEEQVQKLQKESFCLSSLFSKNVMKRRSQCRTTIMNGKNAANPTTNKRLPINKNFGGQSIAVIENVNVKIEVFDCELNKLPADSQVKTERDNLVNDLWLDEDEFETVHKHQCENVFNSHEDIDIKYSYDATFPNVAAAVDKQVEQLPRLSSTNEQLDQKATKISTEELLKTVRMPVIHLKRLLLPCGSGRRHSPNIVSSGKETPKCENGLDDLGKRNTYSKKRFKCREISCSKSFKSAAGLKRHKNHHSGVKPFKCSLCSKQFRCLANLRQHKRCHSDERPHQCSFCKKSFKWLWHLKDHKRIHSGERPYKCRYCSKSFTTAGDLKRHEATHSAEKPFKCSFCVKSFKSLRSLNAHKKIHSEVRERPYICSFCEKSFYNSRAVERHEIIHTGSGGRRYKCSICEKTYRDSHYLKEHRKRKHGVTKK